MPEVTIDVAGRSYRIGCGEGEEVHLVRLAEMVDTEATRLSRKLGNMTEGRLMLMSALMLADKLAEAQNARTEAEDLAASATREAKSQATAIRLDEQREAEIAATLDALAARIEVLAGRVEETA